MTQMSADCCCPALKSAQICAICGWVVNGCGSRFRAAQRLDHEDAKSTKTAKREEREAAA
jgi:hypothetical protein